MPKQKQLKKEKIDPMPTLGFIGPAQTEWVLLIVIVPNNDNTLHFSFDYQKLNAVTIEELHPIQSMEGLIGSLGDMTTFATLHPNSRYWLF